MVDVVLTSLVVLALVAVAGVAARIGWRAFRAEA
jgi:type II secretory pathway pseudopilin PulG